MKKDILFLLFLINLTVVLNIFLTLYYKHNICTFAGWKKKQNKNTKMDVNTILKPLLTEKKWSLRVTISLSNLCWLKKKGSLRVIILLSNLCWLKMDHWGWQYYCHICWNKIEIAGSTIRLKMWKGLWHTDEQWKLFHQKCLTESSAQMT